MAAKGDLLALAPASSSSAGGGGGGADLLGAAILPTLNKVSREGK